MLERKHKGILSLNLKKLANRVDDLKMILPFKCLLLKIQKIHIPIALLTSRFQ